MPPLELLGSCEPHYGDFYWQGGQSPGHSVHRNAEDRVAFGVSQ